MRVACLSDIHGNVVALEAVLEDIERTGVDRLVVGGDLLAFGPRPREVLDRLEALPRTTLVRGNTDRWLGEVLDRPKGPFDDAIVARLGAPLHWAIEQVGEDRARQVATLPAAATLPCEEVSLRVDHASPGSDMVGLRPESTDAELAERLAGASAEVFACGHTHKPMIRRVAGALVVNDGSVGLPYDGVPAAAWALLEIDGARCEASIRRVEVDRGAVIADARDRGMAWAEVVAARLEQARKVAPRELIQR